MDGLDWLDGLDPLRSLVPLEHLAVLINQDRAEYNLLVQRCGALNL